MIHVNCFSTLFCVLISFPAWTVVLRKEVGLVCVHTTINASQSYPLHHICKWCTHTGLSMSALLCDCVVSPTVGEHGAIADQVALSLLEVELLHGLGRTEEAVSKTSAMKVLQRVFCTALFGRRVLYGCVLVCFSERDISKNMFLLPSFCRLCTTSRTGRSMVVPDKAKFFVLSYQSNF